MIADQRGRRPAVNIGRPFEPRKPRRPWHHLDGMNPTREKGPRPPDQVIRPPGSCASDQHDGAHPAPQAGCGCGIYGWYAPTDTGPWRQGLRRSRGTRATLTPERGFTRRQREDRRRGHPNRLLASRVTSVDAAAPRLSWHGLVKEDHLAFASLDRRASEVLLVEDLGSTDHTGRAGSHVLSTHRTGRSLVPDPTTRRPGAAVPSRKFATMDVGGCVGSRSTTKWPAGLA